FDAARRVNPHVARDLVNPDSLRFERPRILRSETRAKPRISPRSGKTLLREYRIRYGLLFQSFADARVSMRARIVSDLLMSLDHLRRFTTARPCARRGT